ncbi:MAG: hypothetical protein ACI9C4_001786, partial [Paraglaciecola sp.]
PILISSPKSNFVTFDYGSNALINTFSMRSCRQFDVKYFKEKIT